MPQATAGRARSRRRQIGVRLPLELWERLRVAARAEDRPISQIVRWALESYFGLRQRPGAG